MPRTQPVLRELQPSLSFHSRVAAGAITWMKTALGECWAGQGGNQGFGLGQVELEVCEIPGEMSRGQLGTRIAGAVWAGPTPLTCREGMLPEAGALDCHDGGGAKPRGPVAPQFGGDAYFDQLKSTVGSIANQLSTTVDSSHIHVQCAPPPCTLSLFPTFPTAPLRG